MTTPALKIGDAAVHVERILGGRPSEIYRVTIVRETKTLWITRSSYGSEDRWRKSDGRSMPDYMGCRFLMTVADFEAASGGAS